jgi:predicted flap endonuclease-1-like 5' DNA nuclease
MFDRSTKLMAAIFILVAAILMTLNLVSKGSPLKDWWFVLLLFFIAAALWVSVQVEDGKLSTADKAKSAVETAKEAVTAAKDKETVKKEVVKPPVPEPVEQETPKEKEPKLVEKVEPVVKKETKPKTEPKPVKKVPEPAKEDAIVDLTRIEGVGPKYRDALIAAGITTFAKLAESKLEDIQAAAKAAGMNRSKSMATWAEQAGYAAREDWDGLDKLQKQLDGGKK